ncbi:MAG: hypothetical protein U5K54_28250 [Cytophagales bacterium]|nr:hypothetical protein [Cytophagales bacterium]
MDSILKPDHLGLALETNLIRDAASAEIYKGVKDAANNTAGAVHARNPSVPMSVSVQVDHAWGKLGGGTYKGVAQDYIDFPLLTELGLSSYAYFGFKNPTEIPMDYYSRLVAGKDLPVFVTEGGWASASINTDGISFTSTRSCNAIIFYIMLICWMRQKLPRFFNYCLPILMLLRFRLLLLPLSNIFQVWDCWILTFRQNLRWLFGMIYLPIEN